MILIFQFLSNFLSIYSQASQTFSKVSNLEFSQPTLSSRLSHTPYPDLFFFILSKEATDHPSFCIADFSHSENSPLYLVDLKSYY